MDAVLGDLAVLQDHDPVQTRNGRKAVRNNDRSAVLHQILKSRLHQLFTLRVKRTCRLIQHQDRGIDQNSSGNGDPLPLPAGFPSVRKYAYRVNLTTVFRQGKKYRKTRGSLPVNIAQNDFYRTAMASISTSAPFGRAAA